MIVVEDVDDLAVVDAVVMDVDTSVVAAVAMVALVAMVELTF
jgi:hypothetical protein